MLFIVIWVFKLEPFSYRNKRRKNTTFLIRKQLKAGQTLDWRNFLSGQII